MSFACCSVIFSFYSFLKKSLDLRKREGWSGTRLYIEDEDHINPLHIYIILKDYTKLFTLSYYFVSSFMPFKMLGSNSMLSFLTDIIKSVVLFSILVFFIDPYGCE